MIMVDELMVYNQKPKPGAERWFGNGKRSSHLTTDGDFAELHAFAAALDMPRWLFQGDHYDLTPSKRKLALNGVTINGVLVRAKFVPIMDQIRQGLRTPRVPPKESA
jgi:hypothetical protein